MSASGSGENASVTSNTSSCPYKWKRRLPASKFGSIVRAGERDEEVARSLLDPSSTESEATLYGKEHERICLTKLENVLGVTIAEGKKVVPRGHRWLVCIPDGLLEKKDGIVEVKCPFKCREKSFETLAETDQNFCLKLKAGGKLGLSHDHDYYYQVQGMLNMMDRQVCYFAVWSPSQFHYQVIEKDQELWQTVMFPKLLEFYRKHVLDNKWNIPDIAEEDMEEAKIKILEELSVSEAEAEEVERKTRGQAENSVWRDHRARRLTASNFGRVGKMRSVTSPHNIVLSILYPDPLSNLPAIKHGRESEALALAQLEEILRSGEGGEVKACGLFVDSDTGYLAASPDGVIDDQTLVEIKCPLKCLEATIQELATSDRTFCLHHDCEEGRLRLKKSHNYYYQIQGQLHCAKRKECIFFLWSPTEYHMETVSYDPEFWSDLQQTLSTFYLDCLLPEMVDPRAPRGMKIRQPEYLHQSEDCKESLFDI